MIGERLKEVRKDHGDGQKELAEKIGATLAMVRCWEQEKSAPSHEHLVSICKLYGVSSDYLLGISNLDPVYEQRRRISRLTPAELAELKEYENYLIYKRAKK